MTSLEGVELGNKFLKYKNMMKEGIIIYDNGVNRGKCNNSMIQQDITYSVHSWPTSWSFVLLLEEKENSKPFN